MIMPNIIGRQDMVIECVVQQTLGAMGTDANGSPTPTSTTVIAQQGDGKTVSPLAPGPWTVQVELAGFYPSTFLPGQRVIIRITPVDSGLC